VAVERDPLRSVLEAKLEAAGLELRGLERAPVASAKV